jgi:hypothetical protein
MNNTSFNITVPYLFSPISAQRAERHPYIITQRFTVQETHQINQSDFLISNITFIKGL